MFTWGRWFWLKTLFTEPYSFTKFWFWSDFIYRRRYCGPTDGNFENQKYQKWNSKNETTKMKLRNIILFIFSISILNHSKILRVSPCLHQFCNLSSLLDSWVKTYWKMFGIKKYENCNWKIVKTALNTLLDI